MTELTRRQQRAFLPGHPLPEGVVVHRQGYRDPIDGTLRPAVTACGVQIAQPGQDDEGNETDPTFLSDDPKTQTCEACHKAKK